MSGDLERYAESVLDGFLSRFPLPQRPTLVWKNLRVSAGIAKYRSWSITLSRLLLYSEERVEKTLAHEYAHLLAVHRHGSKAGNHGPLWKEAMRDLGYEPSVRHAYEVERNESRQRVAYRCARCGAVIVRSRRLPKGRKYIHAACGGAIQLQLVHNPNRP